MQAVSHLFAWGWKYLYINCKNLEGKTALDILQEQPQEVDNSEMRAILERAGALRASSLPTVTSSYARYLRLPEIGDFTMGNIGQLLNLNVTDERRNALLVVAALLVTVTFQAAITPPGGLWQDDLLEANTTDVLGRSPDDLYKLNITGPHVAGSAIFNQTYLFSFFMIFNSTIFLSSMLAMVVLVPPREFVGWTLAGFSLLLYFCYFISLMIITLAPYWPTIIVLLAPFVFFFVGANLMAWNPVQLLLLNEIVSGNSPKCLKFFLYFFYFGLFLLFFTFLSLLISRLSHDY